MLAYYEQAQIKSILQTVQDVHQSSVKQKPVPVR